MYDDDGLIHIFKTRLKDLSEWAWAAFNTDARFEFHHTKSSNQGARRRNCSLACLFRTSGELSLESPVALLEKAYAKLRRTEVQNIEHARLCVRLPCPHLPSTPLTIDIGSPLLLLERRPGI